VGDQTILARGRAYRGHAEGTGGHAEDLWGKEAIGSQQRKERKKAQLHSRRE